MVKVTRINLKIAGANRQKLIEFCLLGDEQFIAIGWSGAYETNPSIQNYEEYYYAVKNHYGCKANHVHNVFWNAEEGDLFWTRDLDGAYWICRAIDKAKPRFIPQMYIGAVIPVKAYKYGLEVPGQIKASFNKPQGGVCEDLKDDIIIAFSKKVYNDLSGTETYEFEKIKGSLLDNLPDFDLEELIISYIQLHDNYYLISGSLAKKSTTVKIECEFISRDKTKNKKAVVQVKGGKQKEIDALDFSYFDEKGYIVYLYAPKIKNQDSLNHCIVISREQVLQFYNEYKDILPESITKWEDIMN